MRKPRITEEFPPMEIEELCSRIRFFSDLSFQQQSDFVNELVRIHPVISVDWPGQTLFRVRAINSTDKICSVNDVIWPQTLNPKPGRLHVDGHSVVYLATSRETALREVEVENGLVTLAAFSPTPNVSMRVCPIGEIAQILRTGVGVTIQKKDAALLSKLINACPIEKGKAIGIADAFLFELLTSDSFDYDLTSLVSQAILSKNDAIDAFLYPSCMQPFGTNIAIRRDRFWSKYGVTSVSRAKASHLASGFFRFSEIEQVEGIYNSGKFLWAKEQATEESRLLLDPAWRPSANL